MNYYGIRQHNNLKIVGPHVRWQEACLEAFGSINSDQEIKNFGDSHYWATKQKKINEFVNEKEGWFKPYVKNDVQLTVNPNEAMGPLEISKEIIKLTEIIRNGEEYEKAWQEATQYLRFLPVHLCAQLSDIYNTRKTNPKTMKCQRCERMFVLLESNKLIGKDVWVCTNCNHENDVSIIE